MIRRLGGAAWSRLHRLVYIAATAAIVHFLMVVKTWNPEPVIYAAIIAGLLLYRLANALRRRMRPRASPARLRVG
jgi:sulfoxide reductase heme-binding subunit YedZ